jgi:hypothetical protein
MVNFTLTFLIEINMARPGTSYGKPIFFYQSVAAKHEFIVSTGFSYLVSLTM